MHGPFKSRRDATGLVTGWLGFMFGAIESVLVVVAER